MGDKFLINLDIIRNTNRSLQNQKKKNLNILWKLVETDLDDNNMDNGLVKTSSGPEGKLYFHDGASP